MKQIFFAVVYTVILVLGCAGVSFAQVEDTPSLVAKASISQSGGGAGYWQVSGTMTDESGYYDASNLQVGDFVFFTGQGLGFHLPITQIVSVAPPSFTVRVNNSGITAIVGVPTTVGAVYRASSNNGLMPYTSGISNPDQQTLVNYLVQRLDLITGGGGGGGTVVTAAPVTGTGTELNPITMAPATTSAPGSMSAADKVKLNAAITTLNGGTGISVTGTAPTLTVTSTVNAGQVPATATAPLTGTTVQGQLNELAGQTHAPATVTDSPTLDFSITGQNVTAAVVPNSLDSVQIKDGGVRLRELNGSGANAGNVPVFNGTIWAPGTVSTSIQNNIGTVAAGITTSFNTYGFAPVTSDNTGAFLSSNTSAANLLHQFYVTAISGSNVTIKGSGEAIITSTFSYTIGQTYYLRDDGTIATTADNDGDAIDYDSPCLFVIKSIGSNQFIVNFLSPRHIAIN